ncbi:MAG: crossover junction endodeoxyribonuclease RuvC [Anaerolineales bacterium]|nr:crossover junction endodeoxyribonuclease RuvC [Anaerolineales bacterium]
MLVLGIDPGTATTGYGLVREAEDGSLKLHAYGVIRTDSRQGMPARLLELFRGLESILRAEQPDEAAVEELYFQRNVTNAISVGQARGVVLMALAQAGLPTGEYSPQHVKLAVAGDGAADKRQVQEMVRILLGLPEIPRPDDAADALAVAICHTHSRRLLQVRRSVA